jgi:hypothetical protein
MEFVAHGWTKRLGAALEMGRQALHAAKLEFRFPPRITRTFTAPLAPDMRAFAVAKMGADEALVDKLTR